MNIPTDLGPKATNFLSKFRSLEDPRDLDGKPLPPDYAAMRQLARDECPEGLTALFPDVFDDRTCSAKADFIPSREELPDGRIVQFAVETVTPGFVDPTGTVIVKAVVERRRAGKPGTAADLSVADVFSRNYDAMCRLLELSGVGRRINMDAWRPTEPASGTVSGVFDHENVTVLATDGVLAIYRRADGSYCVGHTQRFTGKIEPLGGTSKAGYKGPRKPAGPKKVSKKQKLQDDWDAL